MKNKIMHMRKPLQDQNQVNHIKRIESEIKLERVISRSA